MKRKLINDLLLWKNSRNRLPLILKGARQVGKSYLLKSFGKEHFKNCFHFDFEKNREQLLPLFQKNLTPQTILYNLSLLAGKSIDTETDLVIFDEIQNCPKALTSLKYFAEDMPTLCICAAGSLLGIHLSDDSFPVGKVNFLELFPMSFEEFLWATNNDTLTEIYSNIAKKKEIPVVAHEMFWNILKEYYVVGGMPGVVEIFFSFGSKKIEGMNAARLKQLELIQSYKSDFSKHAGPLNAIHINSVFEKVPKQLSLNIDQSVDRFRFKDVIPGKRHFVDLEGPIHWLEKAGLIYKVHLCNLVEEPLSSYTKDNLFKLFLFDIGILGAMLELSPDSLILQDYGITKGFFAENLVACELKAVGHRSLYSISERDYEIDFLFYRKGKPVPIEVKAGKRKSIKSLTHFISLYNPETAYLISSENLRFEIKPEGQGLIFCPLYWSGKI